VKTTYRTRGLSEKTSFTSVSVVQSVSYEYCLIFLLIHYVCRVHALSACFSFRACCVRVQWSFAVNTTWCQEWDSNPRLHVAFVFSGYSRLTQHGGRNGFSSGAHSSFWFVFGAVELDDDFPSGLTRTVRFFSARELGHNGFSVSSDIALQKSISRCPYL